MPQQLSIEQIRQVANLARLDLSEDEELRLTGQLNDILVQFSRLQELDTTDIPPTSHSQTSSNVLRPDIVVPSLPRDAATANAPEKRDGNFIVPQIVDM